LFQAAQDSAAGLAARPLLFGGQQQIVGGNFERQGEAVISLF